MKKSGTKIIIKPRRARQPEIEPELSSEHEQQKTEASSDAANDDVPDDQASQPADSSPDADEGDDAEGSAKEEEDEDGGEQTDGPEPEAIPQPTPRGRPRGRPRLHGPRPANMGTGRPRGRPRGSGRGRGRPRGSGVGRGDLLMLRLPKGEGDGTDAEENEGNQALGANEGGEVDAPAVTISRKNFPLPPIEGDAYITEDDPKGDAKIDQWGNLLGGRQFKSQTFILPGRHLERRYMLAIDAARTSGFRDSLYYFRRNPLALKLIATQAEKDYLIEIGKLGSHLRTRSVTLVTARSAFKLHGAKMLLDGRIGIDDYYEEKAIAEAEQRGLKAGDLASELLEQQQAAAAETSAAAAKIERSGLGLYRTGGPTTVFGGSGLGPYSDGPLNVAKKAMLTREGVKEENWMFVMAQRTREANSEWLRGRQQAIKGVEVDNDDDDGMSSRNKRLRRDTSTNAPSYGLYEPHTALVHYETTTQPTTARWEVIPDGRNVLGGTKVGNGAWGVAWVDTVMEPPNPSPEDERARVCRSILEAVPS